MKNARGQSLVEYLIIVALVAVGSIAVMRSLGETIQVRFANITNALQDKAPNLQPSELTSDQFNRRGLSNFFHGAGKDDQNRR